MKPCQICHAAVPDDVSLAPSALFCGACGRNAEQVRQAPSLPPGATLYVDPAPGPAGSGGPWVGPPPGGPQVGGPQVSGPPPWAGMPVTPVNASGSGVAPPGLNWGGFLLPFVWGPANSVWIGLVALVGFIPLGITQIAALGVSIYLLLKGNELAWRSGRAWQSEAQFRAVQKSWLIWGLVIAGVSILLSILVSVSMLMSGGSPYAAPQYAPVQ